MTNLETLKNISLFAFLYIRQNHGSDVKINLTAVSLDISILPKYKTYYLYKPSQFEMNTQKVSVVKLNNVAVNYAQNSILLVDQITGFRSLHQLIKITII